MFDSTPDTKQCSSCGKVKPHNEYHVKSDTKDGLRAQCKLCRRNEHRRKKGRPEEPQGFKQCGCCKKVLPHDSFSKCAPTRDGLRRICRACVSEEGRIYREKNIEKEAERHRLYAAKHRDKLREYQARYFRKNIARVSARMQAHRRANHASYLVREQGYRAKADPVRRREYHRNYHLRNPFKARQADARRRSRLAGAQGHYTAKQFTLKLALYKNHCHWCGKKIKGNPHADHLIALTKGGTNDIGNIVPSCAKCNLTKHTKMPWEFMPGRLL